MRLSARRKKRSRWYGGILSPRRKLRRGVVWYGTIPYHRWVLRQTVVVTRRHIFYDVYE